MLILAFILPILIGDVFLRCLLPAFETRPRWAGWLLELSLATGLGMGLTASLYFVLLWTGLAKFALAFECAALLGAAIFIWRFRTPRTTVSAGESPVFFWNWLLLLLLAVCGLLFALSFLEAAANNPQGEWDAWAIWNLRAKFLAAGEPAWRNAVSGLLDKTHPEYPLLLSGFIGRCWALTGETTFTATLAAAWMFPAAACGVLLGSLALLRSVSTGLLGALILFATGAYTGQSMAQYADLPLSFFILAALALLACAERFRDHPGFLAAAGALAGMAAWTKNEGIAFLVLAFIACAVFCGVRSALRFAAGAAPFALLVVAFKTLLAPRIDNVLGQAGGSIASKVFDVGRYWQIIVAFLTDIWQAGFPASHPLLAFGLLALFLRFRPKPDLRTLRVVALPCAGMLVAYFGAMLITRDDLRWQLDTTSERLLMQIWPALVLLGMLALKRPEDHASLPEPSRKKVKARS